MVFVSTETLSSTCLLLFPCVQSLHHQRGFYRRLLQHTMRSSSGWQIWDLSRHTEPHRLGTFLHSSQCLTVCQAATMNFIYHQTKSSRASLNTSARVRLTRACRSATVQSVLYKSRDKATEARERTVRKASILASKWKPWKQAPPTHGGSRPALSHIHSLDATNLILSSFGVICCFFSFFSLWL